MGIRPLNPVRVALVGLLTVLAAGLVVPNVAAQFQRQRGAPLAPPGGMPGADPFTPPGGVPVGPPGMPGGVPPNFPNFPQAPRMPNIPEPWIPGGPGGLGGPLFENVWTCSGCKKEIGRGAFPPDTCPHCNARIINGMGNGDKPARNDDGGMMAPRMDPRGMGGEMRGPPAPAPGVVGGDFIAPEDPLVPLPNRRGGMGVEFNLPNNADPWKSDFEREREEEERRWKEEEKAKASARSMIWTVIGVVAGLSTLLVIGVVLFAIMSQSSRKKPARRRKRRVSRYDDEDDDDEDDYIPRSKRRRYDG